MVLIDRHTDTHTVFQFLRDIGSTKLGSWPWGGLIAGTNPDDAIIFGLVSSTSFTDFHSCEIPDNLYNWIGSLLIAEQPNSVMLCGENNK